MTALLRLRKRRKRVDVTCPVCHGHKVELTNESGEEGYWRKEEYLCRHCDCEWDWTYQRPFFRPRLKIRPPKWARIE